jgi:precorrin-2 dehydrogenase/sirohydrochlorin ferrochelatase
MSRLPPAYPVNLLVAGRPVLVVGGGRVAVEKVRGLLDAGAVVTVVAPDVDSALDALDGVTVERRAYARGDAARYRLAVAATSDRDVNQSVFDDGEAAGVWVNAADDPDRCSYTLPARVRRGDLLLTVSTGGGSPALAVWLRERLEEEFGPEYGALVEMLAEERERLRSAGQPTGGPGWREALGSGMLDRIREGDLAGARELLRTCLSSSSA